MQKFTYALLRYVENTSFMSFRDTATKKPDLYFVLPILFSSACIICETIAHNCVSIRTI